MIQHAAQTAQKPKLAAKLTVAFSQGITAYGTIIEQEFTATEMYEGD